MSTVVEWNGTDVPEAFKSMPPGTYFVQPTEDLTILTEDEELGLLAAFDEFDRGEMVDFDEILPELRKSVQGR